MAFDLQKLQQTAETLADLSTPSTGGDREPHAEGRARARLVGYVETGRVENSYQGQVKQEFRQVLVFELSGPKWKPTEHEGVTYAPLFFLRLSAGKNYGAANEKSNSYKVFKSMNYAGKAKHFVGLLGGAYLLDIKHAVSSKKTTYATIKGDTGYRITAPYYEDVDTGEAKQVKVQPAATPLFAFLWNSPDLDQWDSLTAPDGTDSFYQRDIATADNFVGSPAQQLLLANKIPVPVAKPSTKAPAKEVPAAPAAEEDVLNSVAEPAAPVSNKDAKKDDEKAAPARPAEADYLPEVSEDDYDIPF